MSYSDYTPARKKYDAEFRPSARRWKDSFEEDVLVTYYSNPRIFSCRTERDDTKKPGVLYRDIEDDEDW